MADKKGTILSPSDIKAAEVVLARGDRVELIPVTDGVKVVRVRREEVREKNVPVKRTATH